MRSALTHELSRSASPNGAARWLHIQRFLRCGSVHLSASEGVLSFLLQHVMQMFDEGWSVADAIAPITENCKYTRFASLATAEVARRPCLSRSTISALSLLILTFLFFAVTLAKKTL